MFKRLKAVPLSDSKVLQIYLERLVKHLPKEVQALHITELREHLEFLISDQQARGLSREEAQKEALRRFGAPNPIAERLKRAWLGSPQGRAASSVMALRFTLACVGLPVLGHLLLAFCELYLAGTTCKSPLIQQTLSLLVTDYLMVHWGMLLPILGFLPLFYSWQLRARFQGGPIAAGLTVAVVLISLMCFHSEAMETLLWCQMMLCLGLGLLFRRQPALLTAHHSLTSR